VRPGVAGSGRSVALFFLVETDTILLGSIVGQLLVPCLTMLWMWSSQAGAIDAGLRRILLNAAPSFGGMALQVGQLLRQAEAMTVTNACTAAGADNADSQDACCLT